MGLFSNAEQHLNLAIIEIREALKLIEKMRVMFKNTPEEEIENMRHKLNELEKRIIWIFMV